MKQETRNCQNCKQNFVIEDDDFAFYKKIDVPPPTWCPECRLIRRMSFRNVRTVYKRKVEGTEREILSGLSPKAPLRVFEQEYWHSDKWDPMEYGRDYDFSRPFFEQLAELMREVPWSHRYHVRGINSEYCINITDLKDCYLLFNSGFSEACFYGSEINQSTSCMDATKIFGCHQCYQLLDCEKCYRTFFSSNCVECADVYFSENLVNCSFCFGCINLRHKKYYMFNKPYAKEEYNAFLQKMKLGSCREVIDMQAKAQAHYKNFPQRYMHGYNNVETTGDYIDHSKNTRESFLCRDMEDSRYCQLILFAVGRDCYDMTVAGGELCYEVEEAGGYNVRFSWMAWPKSLKAGQIGLSDLEYTVNCTNSSYLFGCVGVRDKQYCILNKQYSKEEYISLVSQIKKHMDTMPYVDKKGRRYAYGEFFPVELSPFGYNETLAYEYFPLTKEEALERGYAWRDPEPRNYQITKRPEDLPDFIGDVGDDILGETIACQHGGTCGENCITAFKIIKSELEFYRKYGLPLPRLCYNCRHFERIKQRNLLRLRHDKCSCAGAKSDNSEYKNTVEHFHKGEHCSNEFETSYAPDRPEIVYCEQCYQCEVI